MRAPRTPVASKPARGDERSYAPEDGEALDANFANALACLI